MNFDEKLIELKIDLPKAAAPVGSYVATKEVGKLLYISGQISIDKNGDLIKGKLGKNLNVEDRGCLLKDEVPVNSMFQHYSHFRMCWQFN